MEMPDLRSTHVGRNIKKLRQIRGIKQSVLADALNTTQSAVSAIESSAEVDDEKLEIIGNVIGFTPDAIRDFSEDLFISSVGNTNHYDNKDGSVNINAAVCYQMGATGALKEVYERMLKMEQDRNAEMQNLNKDLLNRIAALEAERDNKK